MYIKTAKGWRRLWSLSAPLPQPVEFASTMDAAARQAFLDQELAKLIEARAAWEKADGC